MGDDMNLYPEASVPEGPVREDGLRLAANAAVGPEVTKLGPVNEHAYSVRHFALMTSLLWAYNSSPVDSATGIIARYFLEHFTELKSLNIYDVARECYTSRSGIRRFAQQIGYDNFKDIKANAWESRRHYNNFVGYADHPDYRSYLTDQLQGMLDDMNHNVDEGRLDALATRIHGAERVAFLASDFSSMGIRQLQQQMLAVGKFVSIISDSAGDLQVLYDMVKDDLVVVTSSTGNYAIAAMNQLSSVAAYRVLVTLNHDASLAAKYDETFYLTGKDLGFDHNVYSEYGVKYFYDLLYNRYVTLFLGGPKA